MRWLGALLITLYQKCISPFKGFRCAYGVLHGGHSCSQVIKNELLAEGVISTLPRIKEQFAACREAYKELQRNPDKRRRYCTAENSCDALNCLDLSDCSPKIDSCDTPTTGCDSCGDCGDISCCFFS